MFSAQVTISAAGLVSKMSHRAASTGRDSRSGTPETSRCTCEADKSMPRSANSGARSVVANMPCSAISCRSRHS